MALETIPFDAADYFDNSAAQAELLEDALQSGDASYIAVAIGVIARARGLAGIASGTSVDQEIASGTLAADDPKLSTLLDVVRALGGQLHVQTIPQN